MKVSQVLKLSAVALVLGVAPLQATFAHEHHGDHHYSAHYDTVHHDTADHEAAPAPAEGSEAPATGE